MADPELQVKGGGGGGGVGGFATETARPGY